MKFFLFLLTIATIFNASATDIYDEIPAKGKYAYIKRDAIPANKDVFRKYEVASSKKIIYLCIQGSITYSVRAKWDLNIKNHNDAEDIASGDCSDDFSGYLLLGYKITNEIKF